MITKDELFEVGDKERIWQKYCGFFDLSIDEFMEIQEQLLMEQIELVYNSSLAKKFMPKKPKDISEFRKLVPLTTYNDYADYLNNKNEDVLAFKPYCWTRTSGRGGNAKWIPYTERLVELCAHTSITFMILGCATRKGEVNISSGVRVLHNLPPRPYLPGILVHLMPELLDMRIIPPPDQNEDTDFETRIQIGFQMALRTGVDFLSSLTTVLIKMGERFTESSGQLRFHHQMLHPQIIWRLLNGYMRSRRECRTLLPKDLWPLKGLSCYGMDTAIYRDALKYYWGKEPLELYAATEVAAISTQAWNKRFFTFFPSFCFLEFIPEEEWLKCQQEKGYQPATILLNEVKQGERYEIIVTNFHGMPFLRYRLGDLIKIAALEDEEAGIRLPQMVFDSRVDGLIDISGFARFDEKTVWQAIVNTGIKFEDWTVRKDYEQDKPLLHLYIEPKENIILDQLEESIYQQLISLNKDYEDYVKMIGKQSFRITILPSGSFQQYYERKKASNADMAHLKPPHMNASDSAMQDLTRLLTNP
jgi:hypothetical protein